MTTTQPYPPSGGLAADILSRRSSCFLDRLNHQRMKIPATPHCDFEISSLAHQVGPSYHIPSVVNEAIKGRLLYCLRLTQSVAAYLVTGTAYMCMYIHSYSIPIRLRCTLHVYLTAGASREERFGRSFFPQKILINVM